MSQMYVSVAVKDNPEIVANPKAPHAAALMRHIAEVYKIRRDLPAEVLRRAKIADPSQPSRWARGTGGIGKANAKKLRDAFPLCAAEIDAAVRGDFAGRLERDAADVLGPPVAPAPRLLPAASDRPAHVAEALERLERALVHAEPGPWIGAAVEIFEMQARARPLQARAGG